MQLARLNQSQITGLIGVGALLWVVGVMKIRYTGHILYITSPRRISVCLISVPLSFGLILAAEYLLSVPSSQRILMVSLVTTTTLILDGIALTWFPSLYENESIKKTNPRSATVLSRMGAGWLLYATGFTLAWAILTT